MASKERIAILGGTFDPPHNGHLALACGVADALGLDHVSLMPSGNPNFKQSYKVTPVEHRVRMVELLCDSDHRLRCSHMESDRSGVTYTADTLQQLNAENPHVEILFVIGGDCAEHIMKWRRAREIAQLCTVVAVAREGFDFSRALAAHEKSDIKFKMQCIEVNTPEVSSTEIRQKAAGGESLEGLVPASVEEYIRKNRLYSA